MTTQINTPTQKGWLNSIRTQLSNLSQWLLRPTDPSSLALFRIVFGALMIWEVYRYFQYDRVFRYYVQPHFYFTYELFPMVTPWPEPWMSIHFIAMALFAAGIMLGLFYRYSAFLFFIFYSYVFLLDKAQHNNHYYLIILIAFLLTCVDAHRWLSVDQWWRNRRAESPPPDLVPFWHLFILRAQIVIVYFYAGVAKINADWLAGEPMRTWLANRSDYPFLGDFFLTETGVYFFTYGGLLFDLFIGFFLLWRVTRPLAFVGVLFFNSMNKWLFSIGIFPYMMVGTLALFIEPDTPRRLLKRLLPAASPESSRPPLQIGYPAFALSFVAIFLTIQIMLPLRHWLYPGHVSWTEEGHRFSWHMKLRGKDAQVIFYVTNPETNEMWEVEIGDRLTSRQYRKMSTRPDMIIQFAHHIRDEFHHSGVIKNPIIQADAWASLNGRPYQQFIDPAVDLAQESRSLFVHSEWIVPLQTELNEALTENQ